MIKVLMADDHAIIRKGLKQLLDLTDDICVAGEAANGAQVLEILDREAFDILLLDINMPDTNGVELIEKIRLRHSRPPILVLSMHEDAQIATAALQAGASGYLTKDAEPSQLPLGIRKVAAGGRCIDAKLAMNVSFGAPISGSDADKHAARLTLSEREMEILKLLSEGNSIKQIGMLLSIERGTVSTYKTRIMRKMGFRNAIELMRYAALQGW
ncbi:MAG: response regulator transcription factor [Methylomonas sp.]|nr:response regulator transcription factor [Methylomonas sp.]